MKLDDLTAGEQVFVDANILTFSFEPHPNFGPACKQFLQRIENRELAGFTSTHILRAFGKKGSDPLNAGGLTPFFPNALSEVAHRLMTIEAMQKFTWSVAGGDQPPVLLGPDRFPLLGRPPAVVQWVMSQFASGRNNVMVITVEAVYENGVLRPKEPLPLQEHEAVQITIHPKISLARQTAGMIPWTGDLETLERIATDPEFGIREAR